MYQEDFEAQVLSPVRSSPTQTAMTTSAAKCETPLTNLGPGGRRTAAVEPSVEAATGKATRSAACATLFIDSPAEEEVEAADGVDDHYG